MSALLVEFKRVQTMRNGAGMRDVYLDDAITRIAELEEKLGECADKLENCAMISGTAPEYAAAAVAKFRAPV